MAKKKEAKVSGVDEGKLWAVLSSVFIILFFVPLWITKPRDEYAVFYAKQAFMLLITYIVYWIIIGILGWIPILGWLIWVLGALFIFVLWIIGIVNAASNKKKPLPVIGELAINWFKGL